MATIQDVANLAGVSRSTVSNIINGKASVKSDSVKRVQEAMEALGYQPDAYARGLRSGKNQTVAFICPSIDNAQYRDLFSGISTYADAHNLPLRLYLTQSQPERERKILKEVMKSRFAAAMIITCIPEETQCFEPLLKQNIQLMFLERKPENLPYTAFVTFDYEEIGTWLSQILPAEGNIAFALGRETFSSARNLYHGFSKTPSKRKASVYYLSESAEIAYKHAALWMQSCNVPDVIFCSNEVLAKGISSAVTLFGGWKKPVIYQLDVRSWLDMVEDTPNVKIQLDFFKMGQICAERMYQNLKNPAQMDLHPLVLSETPQIQSGQVHIPHTAERQPEPIRIMMLQGAAAYATGLFAAKYTQLTGIPVDIDVYPYSELCARQESEADLYDILQVNCSSLSHYAKNGTLQCMERPEMRRFLGENFPSDVSAPYSMHDNKIWAIPYMFDAQILFYRRDLFEDSRYKRLFLETYKTKLCVPQNFRDMQTVARFFTRQYNPESPVPYGLTLGGQPLYSIYEWMPRFLEKGGSISCRGEFNIAAAEDSLREYAEAFQFTDPKAADWDFSQQARAFGDGKAAMMMLFQAHLSDHRQHYSFEPDDTIGYSLVSYPILGGWGLGITRQSTQPEAALQFITWLCRNENAVPYNVLGGSLPCRDAFDCPSYSMSHPWVKTARQSMGGSYPMLTDVPFTQWQFEQACSPLIHDCVTGKMSPRDTAQKLAETIHSLCESASKE